MATSKLEGGYIKQSGTRSVPTGSVTDLAGVTLPSEGLWLVFADTSITTAGNANANLHCRLNGGGEARITQISAVTGFHAQSNVRVTSGAVTLDGFHNCGSAQTIAYELTAIKIR